MRGRVPFTPVPEEDGGVSRVDILRRLLSFPTLISFGVAAAFLIFLVARFDVDLATTWTRIKTSNPLWYLLAFLIYYFAFLIRGWRWNILLNNVCRHSSDQTMVPSSLSCAQFLLLGWFANSVVGFRLGDAYRSYLVANASRSSLAQTMGTVLAERIMDVLLVFFLLTAAALWVSSQFTTASLPVFVLAAFILGLIAVGGLWVMWRFGSRLAHHLPRRLEQIYRRLQEGTLGSFHRLPILGALGFLGWMCEAARLGLVTHALGVELSVPFIIFVSLANALLTTLPITPGGLGVVEPGIVGLMTLRLSRDAAVSTALLDRSISYISIVILGGVLFLIREITRSRNSRGRRSS